MITTFQLGRDAIGNVPPPHFVLARDLILSQFSIDCCQKCVCLHVPRTPLGAYSVPPDPPPSGKCGSQTLILRSADSENEPPPLPNPGYGPVDDHRAFIDIICRTVPVVSVRIRIPHERPSLRLLYDRPHQCDSEGGRIRGVLLYRMSTEINIL